MSADATGHVYRHAPFRGATLLVLLAIADTVSDQWDNECWMSFNTLAIKSRCNRDTVRTSVKELVDTGWLEVVRQSQGGSASVYRFLFDDERAVEWEGRRKRNPHRTTRGSAASDDGSNTRVGRESPAGQPRDTRGTAARDPNGSNSRRTRRDVAAERAAARAAGTACETCQGSEWVLTDDDVPTTVPCPACNTATAR